MDTAGEHDPVLREYCHFIAHAIGRHAALMLGATDAALRECDHRCHSGCVHGVIEQVFFAGGRTEHFTLPELEEQIPEVCTAGESRAASIQCTHGLGHAILSALEYDLPQALRGCDRLPDRTGRQSCQLGVFMENIITDQQDKRWLKEDKPLYPCTVVEEPYRRMCMTEQPRALVARGLTPDAIADICASAGTLEERCLEGLGRDTSGPLRTGKFAEVAAVCTGRGRACIGGAVKAAIDMTQDASLALPYCTAFIDVTEEAACFSAATVHLRAVYGWTKEQQEEACGGTALCCSAVDAEYVWWKQLLRWVF